MDSAYGEYHPHPQDSEIKSLNFQLGNSKICIDFEGDIHVKLGHKAISIKQPENKPSCEHTSDNNRIFETDSLKTSYSYRSSSSQSSAYSGIPSFSSQFTSVLFSESLIDEKEDTIQKESVLDPETGDAAQSHMVGDILSQLPVSAYWYVLLPWYIQLCRWYTGFERLKYKCEILSLVGDILSVSRQRNHIGKRIRDGKRQEYRNMYPTVVRKFIMEEALLRNLKIENELSPHVDSNEPTLLEIMMEMESDSLRSVTNSFLSFGQYRSYIEECTESQLNMLKMENGKITNEETAFSSEVKALRIKAYIKDTLKGEDEAIPELTVQEEPKNCVLDSHVLSFTDVIAVEKQPKADNQMDPIIDDSSITCKEGDEHKTYLPFSDKDPDDGRTLHKDVSKSSIQRDQRMTPTEPSTSPVVLDVPIATERQPLENQICSATDHLDHNGQAPKETSSYKQHLEMDIMTPAVNSGNEPEGGAMDVKADPVEISSHSQSQDTLASTVIEDEERSTQLASAQVVVDIQAITKGVLETQILNDGDLNQNIPLEDTNVSSHTGYEIEERENQKCSATVESDAVTGNNVITKSGVNDVKHAALKSCNYPHNEENRYSSLGSHVVSGQTEHDALEDGVTLFNQPDTKPELKVTRDSTRESCEQFSRNYRTDKRETVRKYKSMTYSANWRHNEDWWEKRCLPEDLKLATKKWFGSEDTKVTEDNSLTVSVSTKNNLGCYATSAVSYTGTHPTGNQSGPKEDLFQVHSANSGLFKQHSPFHYNSRSDVSRTHSHFSDKSLEHDQKKKGKVINPAEGYHSSKAAHTAMDSSDDNRQYPPDYMEVDSEGLLPENSHVHVAPVCKGHSAVGHVSRVYNAENTMVDGRNAQTSSSLQANICRHDENPSTPPSLSNTAVNEHTSTGPVHGTNRTTVDRMSADGVSAVPGSVHGTNRITVDRMSADRVSAVQDVHTTQTECPSINRYKNQQTKSNVNARFCSACVGMLMDHTGDSPDTINIKEKIIFLMDPRSFHCRRQTAYGLARGCFPNKEQWRIDFLMLPTGIPHETAVHNVLKDLKAEGMKLGHVVQYFIQDGTKRMDIIQSIAKIHTGCEVCSAYFDTGCDDVKNSNPESNPCSSGGGLWGRVQRSIIFAYHGLVRWKKCHFDIFQKKSFQ